MRIDDKSIASRASSLESTERAEADKRAGRSQQAPRDGRDSVSLSSDAQLLHGALKAAADAPATRAERVEAVRQKLAAGEIGNDPARLADRLIDSLLAQ